MVSLTERKHIRTKKTHPKNKPKQWFSHNWPYGLNGLSLGQQWASLKAPLQSLFPNDLGQ